MKAYVKGKSADEISKLTGLSRGEVERVISAWLEGTTGIESGLEGLAKAGALDEFNIRLSEKGERFFSDLPTKEPGLDLLKRESLLMQPFRPERGKGTDIPADTILIGKKPTMAYAVAVMMHFNSGSRELTIRARGRAISTAVDVAEVVNKRFFKGGLSEHVTLGTELVGEGEDARNVSTIEIHLERPQGLVRPR